MSTTKPALSCAAWYDIAAAAAALT
jgi:hypothetical protein